MDGFICLTFVDAVDPVSEWSCASKQVTIAHELLRLHDEPRPRLLALDEVRALASHTELHRMLAVDEALRLNYAAMAWRERAKITAALAQLLIWHEALTSARSAV